MRSAIILLLSAGAALSQTTYQVGTTPFTASSQSEGASAVSYFGKTNTLVWLSGDGRLRWNGNHSSIAATIWDDPATAAVWCLYQDGSQVGSCYTAASDNNWGTTTPWTGLSGTHLYELFQVNTNVVLNNNRVAEVIVTGGTGLSGSKPSPLPLIAGCGDSIAVYVSTQTGQHVKTDVRYGDYWLAGAQSLGYVGMHWGATGRMVSGASGLYSMCAAQTQFSPAPTIVLLTGGVNDMDANVTAGAPHNGDTTTFEGALYAEFTNVWANSPAPLKVFQRGILPNSYGGSHLAAIATWNGYEQAVVNQWNIDHPSTPVTFIDPTGWFDPVSDVSSDGLHPLDSGYSKMAAKEQLIFQSLLNIPSKAGQSLALASYSYDVTDPNRASNLPFRIEFQIHDWSVSGTDENLLTLNGTGVNVILKSTGTIQFQDARDTMSPGAPQLIPPAGCNDVLVRAQRDPVTMTFSSELWCWNSTGYVNAISAINTVNYWPYSGGKIGDTGLVANIGFVHVFTTLVPMGSRVPTTADGGDWTELKFDGDLSDSTSNGNNASGPGATYVATPDLVPVSLIRTYGAPFWSNQVSFRAGHPGQMDGTSSYSMAPESSGVSYFWQLLGCPGAARLSSHTASQPTISGLVFGDCLVQLQVTDTAGNTALSTLHVGAVSTDNNGIVVNANPAADLIFGPMIAFGKNPWQYQDYIALHSAQVRSSYINSISPPSWINNLAGTISYQPFYYTTPYQTTLNGSITSTAATIALANASALDLSSLPGTPTIIQLGLTSGATEEVAICSASGNVLTVCYDGRGWRQGLYSQAETPQAWANGTMVTQMKTTGTSTTFLTDFCPAGPGEEGQIIYSAGTVSATAGSATITGSGGAAWTSALVGLRIRISGTHSGTAFAFFAGISVVTDGTHLTLSRGWPSDADTAGGLTYAMIQPIRQIARGWLRADSSTGQQLSPVSACESNTQMYESAPDSIAGNNTAPQSSQNYSYSATTWTSEFGPNYYDEVLAHYAGYYRSGLNTFRDNARGIGDYWAKMPEFDEGYIGITPRHAGITGVAAGAILDGRAGNWTTIRNMASNAIINPYSGGAVLSACDSDVREDAYGLSWIGLAAMFDPIDTGSSTTPKQRSYWKAQLANAYTRDVGCKTPQNTFDQGYWVPTGLAPMTMTNGSPVVTGTGIPSSLCNVASTGAITVTNGSSTAIGTGFIAGSGFIVIQATYNGGASSKLFYSLYVYKSPTSITLIGQSYLATAWQWDSGTFSYKILNDAAFMMFASSISDHANLNNFFTCTYNSATQITLDRNWTGCSPGPTCSMTANKANVDVGVGSSVFMNGIKTLAMRYAALGATGATATNYAALDQATANWVLTTGFDENTKGLYYYRGPYQCEPMTIGRYGCSYNPASEASIEAARTLNGEAQNAMSIAYQANPTSTNLTFGDQFYGGQWGKPGYGTPPYSDGSYLSALDSDGTFAFKWIGFLFGVGMSHQWPAERLGGVAPADMRTLKIPFTLATLSNAVKVRITLTSPTGATAPPIVCMTSPCNVTVDGRIGSPVMRIDYLNSSDRVIAAGDTVPLYVSK